MKRDSLRGASSTASIDPYLFIPLLRSFDQLSVASQLKQFSLPLLSSGLVGHCQYRYHHNLIPLDT